WSDACSVLTAATARARNGSFLFSDVVMPVKPAVSAARATPGTARRSSWGTWVRMRIEVDDTIPAHGDATLHRGGVSREPQDAARRVDLRRAGQGRDVASCLPQSRTHAGAPLRRAPRSG